VEKNQIRAAGATIDDLDFCRYGNPSEAFKALLEILKADAASYLAAEGDHRKWACPPDHSPGSPPMGHDCLLWYFLNVKSLLEPGGAAMGSRVSAKGKGLVEFLEAYGTAPEGWPQG
jgi:hypothetical protein